MEKLSVQLADLGKTASIILAAKRGGRRIIRETETRFRKDGVGLKEGGVVVEYDGGHKRKLAEGFGTHRVGQIDGDSVEPLGLEKDADASLLQLGDIAGGYREVETVEGNVLSLPAEQCAMAEIGGGVVEGVGTVDLVGKRDPVLIDLLRMEDTDTCKQQHT